MVMASYLVHHDTLLQNATDTIKCDSYFITRCDKIFLQNESGFLLRKATVLLENTTVITKYIDIIIKCDSYYKMLRLLQNALVQWLMVNETPN